MIEGVLTVLAVALVLGVGIPLVLLYLFARQVFPNRPLATGILIVAGALTFPLGIIAWAAAVWLQVEGRRARRHAVPAPTAKHGSPLGREWARLAAEAASAAARYQRAGQSLPTGPLRERLADLHSEVAGAVDEARRLAVEGDRLARAHRDVERALLARRKSVGRGGQAALQQSLTAQSQSAARLATAVAAQRERLQLLVCRLDELAAHATELTALPTSREMAAAALVDQVAALRLATLEVAALSR